MAIPQCAIAHDGSAATIFSNCGRASSYQKSWSNATPRLKLARTAGEHETGNDTVPRRSPATGVVGSLASRLAAPAASGSRAMQTRKDIQTDVRNLMTQDSIKSAAQGAFIHDAAARRPSR